MAAARELVELCRPQAPRDVAHLIEHVLRPARTSAAGRVRRTHRGWAVAKDERVAHTREVGGLTLGLGLWYACKAPQHLAKGGATRVLAHKIGDLRAFRVHTHIANTRGLDF